MRIIIYGINYAPEEVGIGKYTAEFAEWLKENGNDVKVITSCTYYPYWVAKINKYFKDSIKSIDIYRCPIWVPKKPSGLKRLIHLISFAITSFPMLLSFAYWKADVVFTIAPSLFCAPATIFFKFFSRKTKNWIHIQDFELDAAFELNLLKGKFLRKSALYLERKLLLKFDRISTISQSMYDFALKKNLDKNKLILFPNWVDTASIVNQESVKKIHNPYFEEMKLKEIDLIIMYSGTMGEKQGLDVIPLVINYFKDYPNIVWLLAGEGPLKDFLKENLRDYRNVKLLPLQPKNRLNDWINIADIHLLPQRKGAECLVLPSKVLAILASGKPFVASSTFNSDLGKLAEIAGLRVDPDNSNDFISALEKLINNDALRKRLGNNGRNLALSFFEKEKILRKINNNLKALVNE